MVRWLINEHKRYTQNTDLGYTVPYADEPLLYGQAGVHFCPTQQGKVVP